MVADLVDRLLARGIHLRAEGERLVCRAPAGALTPDLREEVERHKAALVEMLREAGGPGRNGAGIPPAGENGPWVLSTAQERFWLMETLSAEAGVYNVPGAFRLEGPLAAEALEEALHDFVERHAVLNVRFEARGGEVRMVPAARRRLRLERIDLQGTPPDERPAALRNLLETWAEEPLDLEGGDTFRARLVALGPEEHALFVVSHAAVWDGWSFDVMLAELASLYPARLSGTEDGGLPPLGVQYPDYAAWHRRRLADGSLEPKLSYWRERLESPLPLVDLPTDDPRPAKTFSGARLNFALDDELVAELGRVARSTHATLYMVLLAGFAALLHRHTRQEDVTVLTPVRGRDRPELEALVGCFANMMPVRLRPDPTVTFLDFLGEVRTRCLDGYANAEAPFEVTAGDVERRSGSGGGASGLFRATFTYQNTGERRRRIGELRVSTIARDHRRCYSEVSLWVREHSSYVDGALDYRTDLFRSSTMEDFLMHYETLLREVARDPGVRLRDLLLFREPAPGAAPLDVAPGSSHVAGGPPVTEALRAWADRDPGRIALEAGGARLTYGDLLRCLEADEPPDVDAGEPVVAVLRALRAGTGCGLHPGAAPGEEDRAVGGVLRHVAALVEADPDDVVLAPWSLDTRESLLSALLPLMVGARAFLVEDPIATDEWALADILDTSRVTILPVHTRVAGRLRDTEWEGDAMLRVLCIGGEPSQDVADWLAHHTGGAWWVAGVEDGPAWALHGSLGRREAFAGLAHPLPGVRFRVVDADGRAVLRGVPGELAFKPPAGSPKADRSSGLIATGERARQVGDGAFQRLGRLDGRVSVDGELVDPGETERILVGEPAVLDAAVSVVTPPGGRRRLVAHLVWRRDATPPTTTELRGIIRDRLGEAHVPSAFVAVGKIPRGADGRALAGRLPSPFAGQRPEDPADGEPRTANESLVAEVWRQLLCVDRVRPGDDFYTLGGDSLMLMRAVELIEERTGTRLDPRILFFHPLEGVAQALTDAGYAAPTGSPA